VADKNFKVKTGLDLPQPLSAAQGGTGQSSLTNALNAMLPAQTSAANKVLSSDGTNTTWVAQNVAYQRGNTASRPASPTVGDLYFNSELNYFESYTANGWFPIAAAPGIPTGVTATNQGTSRAFNNGQMSVAFTAATNGGAPTSFILTPNPATSPTTFTSSTSPIVVTGLSSSTQYTHTVVSTSPYGTSAASSASSAVTATTVPAAPSISAVAASQSATITITPGATGGSAITSYSIVSNPATTTQTTSSTTYTFTGLTDGTAYTFTATATNANGTSAASAASSSITPISGLSVDILTIAGGGSGGRGPGGGGGAGGLVYSASQTLTNSDMFTVLVGAGSAYNSTVATDSGFFGNGLALTRAYGGGSANSNGGSGGGWEGDVTNRFSTGISGQGNNSGTSYYSGSGGYFYSSGGGGAGGVGGSSYSATGYGGVGLSTYSTWGAATSTGQNISGTYWYAGGGGSGGSNNSGSYVAPGAGGNGGGGTGGNPGTNTGTAGTAGTGGGGGGGGYAYSPNQNGNGGNGGAGVTIVRYQSATQRATGGTVTTSGGYYYHTFTSSGSFSTGYTSAKATGGFITLDSTYVYHTFFSTGTFVPSSSLTADIIKVGGGGGGCEAGGGAGGFLYHSGISLGSGITYTATIGAGGPAHSTPDTTNGSSTTLTGGALSLTTSYGGGYGSQYEAGDPAGNGGSGGGGRASSAAGSGTSGQGNNGGSGTFYNGGGGGGIGGVGGAGGGQGGAYGTAGPGTSAYSSWGLLTGTGYNSNGTCIFSQGGNSSGGPVKTGTPASGFGGSGYTSGGSGVVIIRYLK